MIPYLLALTALLGLLRHTGFETSVNFPRERSNGKARKPVIRLRTWTEERDGESSSRHAQRTYLLKYMLRSPYTCRKNGSFRSLMK